MLLSTLLAQLKDESEAEAVLMTLDDLVLKAGIEEMRSVHAETPGQYAAGAVHRFANAAKDEDWLSLIPAIQRSDDPARAALSFMLRWSVAADRAGAEEPSACACGKGHSCGDD